MKEMFSVFTLKKYTRNDLVFPWKVETTVRCGEIKVIDGMKETYHIAISEVVTSEFGIRPATNTRISKAQYSKLLETIKK